MQSRCSIVAVSPDDGRVTWLGGLQRRTHVDELPQMLNIARGFGLDARLFGAALMLAFVGVGPRRRGRTRPRRHGADRFDRAYRALRGEE